MRSMMVLALLAAASTASAAQLFTNGPVVTNPTGGTGGIAGQPISQGDAVPIGGGLVGFTHVNMNATLGRSVADDFVVPAGQTWDLDSLTVYLSASGQTTATATQVTVNLWSATPFSANSPAPVPDPLPTPVLAAPLSFNVTGTGVFTAYRQGNGTATSSRPIFAYTVSLDGLPNAGELGPGTYWMEWSATNAAGGNMQTSPVPRALAFNANARLFNSIDGGVNTPNSWFEGREPPSVAGLAYALPFSLTGTATPEPATLGAVSIGLALLGRKRR